MLGRRPGERGGELDLNPVRQANQPRPWGGPSRVGSTGVDREMGSNEIEQLDIVLRESRIGLPRARSQRGDRVDTHLRGSATIAQAARSRSGRDRGGGPRAPIGPARGNLAALAQARETRAPRQEIDHR